MNKKEKQLRFSIRKLKVAVASIVVGVSVFGPGLPTAQAIQLPVVHQSMGVAYRYVLESELTQEEQTLLQSQLPSHQVGAYSTYYMIYRPTASLPETSSKLDPLLAGLGMGLLIIGVSLIAGKKRRLISSIFVLTAAGAVSVSALGGGSLSVYDRTHQLTIGDPLPETAISIANHEFVGYLLEKAVQPSQQTTGVARPVTQPASQESSVELEQSVNQEQSGLLDQQPTPTQAVGLPELVQPGRPASPVQIEEISQPTKPVQPAESVVQTVLTEETKSEQPEQPTTAEKEPVLPQPTVPSQPVLTDRVESIDFETEVIEDASLPIGQEEVVQKGRQGQKLLIFSGDQLVSEEVLIEVQNQIIRRGTKLDASFVEAISYDNVPFAIQIEEDSTLPLGEEILVQSGQPGRRENKYLDGQLVSSRVIEEPVAQIIKRGTKVIAQPVETTDYEDIAFDTHVEEDSDLPLGEEILVQSGQPGRRENKYLDGQLVSGRVVEEPVAQIIKRGTKVIAQPVETIDYEDIAFETHVEEDSDLPLGEEILVRAGQPGRRENKYLDGQLVSSRVVEEPVAQIIKRGTKAIAQPVETIDYEDIAFETHVEEDSDLPLGEEVIVQAGQVGRKENKYLDGQLVSSRAVEEPVAQIIKRGTKVIAQPVETTDYEDIAFDTHVEEDSDLSLGEEVIVQAGQVGRKENKYLDGQLVSSRVIEDPVAQIIKRGTKAIAQPVETTAYEDIAFETQVEEDSTLPLGEEILVRVGQAGRKENKYLDDQLISSRVIEEPVAQIIKRGTKVIAQPVEMTDYEDIAFDTHVEEDSDLPLGEEVIVQSGQVGRKENKYLDGQLVSSRVVEEPVAQIIKRGTKAIAQPVETTAYEDIAFDTHVEEDSDLPLGEEVIVQSGQVGRKEDKYLDGQLVSSRVIEEPVAQVIKRGTKLTVNKTPLRLALADGESHLANPYTPESVATLRAVLDYSRAVLSDASATQEQVNQQVQSLKEAVAGLVVPKETVVETYREQIPFKQVLKLDATLPKGEQVTDQVGKDGLKEIIITDGVITAERILLPAQDELIRLGTLESDKTRLRLALQEAASKQSSDYTPISYAALQEVMQSAQAVFDNPSVKQSEIDSKLVALNQAISQLRTDKTALQGLVDEAKSKQESDYSSSSYATLSQVLSASETLLSSDAAKQSELATQEAALRQAISDLMTDKALLKSVIDTARSKVASDYEPSKFSVMQSVLTQAQALYANASAKQSEIDAQVVELNRAISNLTTDKTALEQALALAQTKESGDYSSSSYVALTEVVSEAQTLLDNPSAKQSELDAQVAELNRAISNLTTDKTALQAAVTEAKAKRESDYSPSSYANLTRVLGASENLLSSSTAKQSELNNQATALRQAIAGLTTDKSALQHLVEEAKAKRESDYSSESYANLSRVLGASENLLSSDAAKQSELNSQVTALRQTIAGLTTDKSALQRLVEEAKAKRESDYSPSSYTNLTRVLGASETLLASNSAKQSELNSQVTALRQAISGLTTDKTALEQALALAQTKESGDYSSSSYTALTEVIGQAQTLLDNPSAKQSELDAKVAELNRAISNLTTDKTVLEQSLALAQTKESGDYSSSSYVALTEVVSQSQTLLDNPSAKQSELDAQVVELNRAISSLTTDKTALEQALTLAQTKEPGDYSSSSYAALTEVVSQSQTLLDNSSAKQSEIDAQVVELNRAISTLTTDKTALEQALALAQTKSSGDYSSSSYATLTEVVSQSQTLLDNASAKQSELDVQVAELNRAISNLMTDKTALEQALVLAQTKSSGDYSPSSYAALTEAVSQSQTLLDNPSAKQSEIDAQVAELNRVISNLTTDKTALEQALALAQTKEPGDYSPSSYAALTELVSQAQTLLDNPSAKQSEIDVQVAELNRAISNLTTDKTELEQALALAQTKPSGDYSSSSYVALTEVVSRAQTLLDNPSAKQSELDAQVAELNRAISNLTTDKTALEQALALAQTKESGDYSPSSYAALTEIVSQSQTLLDNPSAKQSEIDAQAAELNRVISNLTTDKTALEQALALAQTKSSGDYSPSSYTALTEIVSQSQTLFDNPSAKQSEIDAQVAELNRAISNLTTDKTALKSAIDTAHSKVAADYETSKFSAMQSVLTQAQSLYDNASAKQSEIDAQVVELNRAISNLTTDKTALGQALALAQTKPSGDYSSSSYTALTEVVTQAQTLLDNPSAKQSEIDAQVAELNRVISNLTTDKTALEQALALAQTKPSGDYSSSSYAALTEAVSQAQTLLDNPSAKQSELDAQVAKFNRAISNLTTDKSALEQALAFAQTKASGDYSSSSYAALTEVVNQSQTLLDNPSAKQSEIDTQVAELNRAISNLTTDKAALQAAVTEAKTKRESDYSPSSYANLSRVLGTSETLLASNAAKQSELDAQVVELNRAISNLTTDKTALEQALALAQTKPSGDYSPSSYAALTEVVSQSQTLLDNPSSKQSELDAQVVELNRAISNLTTDKTALEQALALAQSKPLGDYSSSSYAALTEVVSQSQTLLDNPSAKQSEIDAQAAELNRAISNLTTDKTALEQALALAQTKSSGDYSPSSYTALTEIVSQSQTLFDNPSAKQSEIDAQVAELNRAISNLTTDKTALEQALALAQTKESGDYSPSSYANLTRVLGASETLLDSDAVKQSEIDAQVVELNRAISSLTTDKTALQGLVDEAKSKQESDYSSSSYATLSQVLSASETLLSSDAAKQSELAAQETALRQAISALTTDKALLKSVIDTARSKVASDYEPSKFSVMQSVLTQAQALYANASAKQSEIDAQVVELNRAISNLTTDKTALEQALALAQTKLSGDYSSSSYTALTEVVTQAQTLLDNPSAKQSELDAQVAELNRAISNLTTDKTALQAAVTEAKAKRESDYSPSSYANLTRVLGASENLLSSSTAKQSELNNQATALRQAIAGLTTDKSALQRLVEEAKAKRESDYSPSSYTNLTRVLGASETLLASNSAKQSELNSQVTALRQAISGLTTDKTALEQALALAQTKSSGDYSPSSYAALTEIVSQAQTLLDNPSAKQSELDAKVAELNRAISNLTTDKTALEQALALAQTKSSGDYSPSSYAALTEAVSQSQTLLDNPSAKQSELDDKVAELSQAISNLTTDKSELERALALAQTKEPGDYSSSSYAALTEIVGQAQTLLDNPSAKQSELDDKVAELSQAISNLTTDKSELERALALAQTKEPGDYSSSSYAALTEVIGQAQTLLDNPSAKQSEIDAQVAELNRAISNLTTDKTALQAVVTEAKAKRESDYSPSSYANLTRVLGASETLLASNSAKQSELNSQLTALRQAIAGLTTDKTALQAAVTEAKAKRESDYSSASYANLTQVLSASESLLSSSAAKQSELNSQATALRQAIAGLTTDKSALQRLVDEAKAKVETDYSSASYANLSRVLGTSENLLSSNTAKQSELAAQETALRQAIADLTVDRSALQAAVNEAKLKQATDYTRASFEALSQALREAEALLATDTATQSMVNAEESKLRTALDNLQALKQVPTLVWADVTKDDEAKTARVSYRLTDEDNALQSVTVLVREGGRELARHEVPKAELTGKTINLPDYEVPYTLKTLWTYDSGSGPVAQELELKTVELEAKQLEIKDVDSVVLYHSANGQFSRAASLSSLPTSPDQYLVRISSDRFKDLLLPVSEFKEETLPSGQVAYRVKTNLPELVEDKDSSAKSQYQDQFSFLVPKTPAGTNVYTDFKSLVDAMTRNPAGDFVLGSDLFAEDMVLPSNQATYVTAPFTGRLTGLADGRQHAIYNLKAPLFSQLNGATISQLDLKQVAIANNRNEMGALASRASLSTVTDVSVEGSITANRHMGGLVYLNDRSTFNNTSFTGSITANAQNGASSVGGIVGGMSRGVIKNSRVAADITVRGTTAEHRAGGIVGFADGTPPTGERYNVENVLVTGSLTNNGTNGVAGGIIGATRGPSTSQPASLNNVVSQAKVTKGKVIYGYETNVPANRMTNLFAVTDQATGDDQSHVTRLSAQEAANRVAAMAITASPSDSGSFTEGLAYTTDYTSLRHAQPERRVAYDNMEKLLPFYNKEQIVKYGNLIASSDKLATVNLRSVTPMAGNTILSDLNGRRADRIMLHYADDTIVYLPVAYKADFRNTGVAEYSITGTDLIYTPEQFLGSYDRIVSAVLPELRSVVYKSEAVATAITAPITQTNTLSDAMEKLYLEPSFNEVKANLDQHLRRILATDKAVNATGGIVDDYLINYIKTNKEKLLLGLAYMNRWYNLQFDQTNIKDLALYHQDFFGKPVNTLEFLVALADKGYDNLNPSNNPRTYETSMAAHTNQATIVDYLSANRKLFAAGLTDNEWFKKTSKAYIVEAKSRELPDLDVSAFTKLSTPAERNALLPLLTAQEGLFIITSLGSITYGMYDRYYSQAAFANQSQANKVAGIKRMVDATALKHRDYFDAWYRIAPADVKNVLIKNIPVWDGYNVDGKWIERYGAGSNQAVRDFFGPIGDRSSVANNGAGAYANGFKVAYVIDKVLEPYGSSVFSHEMTHNNEAQVYLGGHGRREGVEGETYALGLLQSSSYGAHAADFFTLNLTSDYTDQARATNRYTNLTPDRFKSSRDLQEYMSGIFDVLYTLDYAETKSILTQPTRTKREWWGVIENEYVKDRNNQDAHAANIVRAITDQELNAIRSWEDLVDKNVIGLRQYPKQKYERDGYYLIRLFTPFFAALPNEKGAPGDLMFRRMAFELMAEKGYTDGFLPYASNQLAAVAQAAGSTIYNDTLRREVPKVTDEHVFDHLFGETDYKTWADFKKATFQRRVDRVADIKPVTITFFGREERITSFADIERLMARAVEFDTDFGVDISENSAVAVLKGRIFSAYLRSTDDFKTSIYKSGPDRTALRSAITAAKTKQATDYSTSSYANLSRVLQEAESLVDASTATQPAITAKAAELRQAMANLTVDREALRAAVAEAKLKPVANYTRASFEALSQALRTAEPLLTADTATQSMVNDQETKLREALSKLQALKQVPILVWESLSQDDGAKTATLAYRLTDETAAYQTVTVTVLNGQREIARHSLTKAELASKTISLPDYQVPYTIKTSLTYDIGQGAVTVPLEDKTVELTIKALEVRDVAILDFYHLANDQFTKVTSLPARLDSMDKYLVRVASDGLRDLLLPVQSITSENGTSYRVTAGLDEPVATRSTASPSTAVTFSFLMPKATANAATAQRVTASQTRRANYTSLAKAQAARQTAYENIGKLLPFYNREQIVKYGNLVDTNHKLYQTKLLSVTPMIDNQIIADITPVKTSLNRLMLHYEDGQVAYLNLTYKGDFRNQTISEYTIADTQLLYTPDQFLGTQDSLLAQVLPDLQAVAYKSETMAERITAYTQADVLSGIIAKAKAYTNNSLNYVFSNKGMVASILRQRFGKTQQEAQALVDGFEAETINELSKTTAGISAQMDKLYLEPTFNEIKTNLEATLRKVLATDKAILSTNSTVNRYMVDFIKANKEKLLLGLAYMQRWYNVDFQGTNIRDLATFHQDFFGKQVNTLEWLVQLGSSYDNLVPSRNLTTYVDHMAQNTGKANLLEYLTANRQRFTTYKDDNSWFNATSKAYIVEQQSKQLPNTVVKVYDTLSLPAEQNGILPLLSAREGIFIIAGLGGVTYGMFDRYYDDHSRGDYDSTPPRNLTTREEKTEHIKAAIRLAAKRQGDFFDVWYRLAPAKVRDGMIKRGLTTWDGYRVRGKWLPMYGEGANEAILDFFGPVGDRSSVANNNTGAYANGTKTSFVNNRVLDSYGTSVYTHETTHNNDGGVYLGGYGRREGMGPEAFPTGLLQTSSFAGHAEEFLTLNLAYDFSAQTGATNRTMNVSPERFQKSSDLKDYMHGVFDVLYTLDYAEAQAAIGLSDADKQNLYGVIENLAVNATRNTNKIRNLTEAEAKNLTSWETFIESNIISLREYAVQNYNWNGYYTSRLFSPNYAALSNPTGAPGDLMFRRMAFELLADKGYEEGFIPYTSNQYKPNAQTALTDEHVLRGIYGQTHRTWADAKKAMFRERIDKRHRLASVTFTYQDRQETISSFDDLQRLMSEAMTHDVANKTFKLVTSGRNRVTPRVHELKRAIYNAYLRQTDDFKGSIYKP